MPDKGKGKGKGKNTGKSKKIKKNHMNDPAPHNDQLGENAGEGRYIRDIR